MLLFALLWTLAQPDTECRDRSPGLSKCVEYYPKTVDKGVTVEWGCKAACYSAQKKGDKGYDGGTNARVVYGSGKDQPACKADLEAQAKNGCRP